MTTEHSPDLIDNIYLTGVHSTDSATTSAFMIHLYIPKSTPYDIANIIAAQLENMHKQGIHTSSTQLHTTITIGAFTNTHGITYLDDEPIASGTYLTSKHLEGTPHARLITIPTFLPATYGITLLASRQLRWSTTLPQTSIPTWIIDSLRQPSSTRSRRSPKRMWTTCSRRKSHALSTSQTSKALTQSWLSEFSGVGHTHT